jgi:hypothetical protein
VLPDICWRDGGICDIVLVICFIVILYLFYALGIFVLICGWFSMVLYPSLSSRMCGIWLVIVVVVSLRFLVLVAGWGSGTFTVY